MPAASNWKVDAEAVADAGAMVEAGAGAPGILGKEPKLKLTGALAIGAVEVCMLTAGWLTGAPKLMTEGAAGWVAAWKLSLPDREGAAGGAEKKGLFCTNALPFAMPFVAAPNTPALGDGFSGDCSGEAILMSSFINLLPGEYLVGESWGLKPKIMEGGGA